MLIPTIMTLIVLSPIQNPKQIGPELHTTLNQVATKFGINIVCDAFISDIFVPDYDTSSADNAILDIAKKSGRVFENLNGVYILRKKSANRLRKSEFLNQTTEITPVNNIINLTTIENQNAVEKRYSLFTNKIKTGSLGRLIQNKTKQPIRISPELANRSVYVFIKNRTLPEIFESISYCINSSPEIILKQNPAQMEAESLGLGDEESRRYIASKEIYDELSPLLTEKQKDAVASGQFFEFSLKNLPQNMKESVSDYIKMAYRQTSQLVSVLPPLNIDMMSNFALRFRPTGSGPQALLGVMITGPDGSGYCF